VTGNGITQRLFIAISGSLCPGGIKFVPSVGGLLTIEQTMSKKLGSRRKRMFCGCPTQTRTTSVTEKIPSNTKVGAALVYSGY
jgi:hypothetical protein